MTATLSEKTLRCVAILGLLGGVASIGCESAETRTPNLLLVVVDTLRADRLGSHGNPRGLTPFLDEFAGRGVRFANAFPSSSWTVPSVASLFTSRMPSQHRVVSYPSKLADSEVTLAERLGELDFRSAGFSANPRLEARFGYGQGFDSWQVLSGTPAARGSRVRAASLAWLDRVIALAPDVPIALYLHLMEPHSPYTPPPKYRARLALGATPEEINAVNSKLGSLDDLFGQTLSDDELRLLEQLYDAEVAAADDELRMLFDELSARGFLDNAIVVVTSDHGEEFREHGAVLHGFTLFDAGLQVPLLMSWPNGPRGRTVEQPVSLLDVAPTILELLGVEIEPRFEGRSLLPHLAGDASPPTGVMAELVAVSARDALVRRHQVAWFEGRWKLLVDRRDGSVFYDRRSNPGERPDLTSQGAPAERLRAGLAKRQAELAMRSNAERVEIPLDDELRDRLRELGYVLE